VESLHGGKLKLFAALLLVMGLIGGASAETTFEDFEDGDINGWYGYTSGFSASTVTFPFVLTMYSGILKHLVFQNIGRSR